MIDIKYDTIIVGGSFAGLAAAMSLGRSMRTVLLIDSWEPCNKKAPQSHNFLTHDGDTPAEIAFKARQKLAFYDTVTLMAGIAVSAVQKEGYFEVSTAVAETFTTKKILFATGLKDIMPDIPGFSECWGKSIIHCPYCHGYEVYQEKLAVFGNGDEGFEFAKLISNWSNNITLFTNGPSNLNLVQEQKLHAHSIDILEDNIAAVNCINGNVQTIDLLNGSAQLVQAIFARVPFEQHCPIPQQLGCALTNLGHLQVDNFNATTIPGIYAAGDNSSMMRSVASAVASGTAAGAFINKALIEEAF